MYIESLKIKKEFRSLNPSSIHLKDITILVGDQGSGKSTLLKLLSANDVGYLDISLTTSKLIDSLYFDTERMNPRVIDDLNNHSGKGGIGALNAIKVRFISHGECIKSAVIDVLEKAENSIILIDEPESGLSIRSQYLVVKAIHQALLNNCQVIIATHSMAIIQSFGEVYSLEHNKWMDSYEFIETHRHLNNLRNV